MGELLLDLQSAAERKTHFVTYSGRLLLLLYDETREEWSEVSNVRMMCIYNGVHAYAC